MSKSIATAGQASASKSARSVFERFLTFWVALCTIAGIALDQLLPGFCAAPAAGMSTPDGGP